MLSLKKMSLKSKLFTLIGVSITGLIAFGMLSYTTLSLVKIGSELDNHMQDMDDLRSEYVAPDLNILQARILMYQIMTAKDVRTVESLAEKVKLERKKYDEAQAKFAPLIDDPKLKELVTEKGRAFSNDYFDFAQNQVIPAYLAGDKKKGEALIPVLRDKYVAGMPTLEETLRLLNAQDDVLMSGADRTTKSRTTLLAIMGVGATAMISLLGWFIVRSITSGMSGMLGMIQQISNNNLAIDDIAVTTEDEIGKAGTALNNMKTVPILIVLHMPALFTRSLAERLETQSSIPVREGAEGTVVRAGQAFIAPGGSHMLVARRLNETCLKLSQAPPENFCRPSVDVLFRSVAQQFGSKALAVVLTGMGSDGFQGSRNIREAGGEVILQDEKSSTVWGMPGAVFASGVSDRVYPISQLAPEIVRHASWGRSLLSAGNRPEESAKTVRTGSAQEP
ncbi:MAG TPA: chemotaxis protein CheB [Terriglobales bacterium]|jgi:hypothetical protein